MRMGLLFHKSTSLIFLMLVSVITSAQKKLTDNLSVSGNYHFGYSLPEYSVLSHTITENVQSFDLSFHKERTGKDIYEQLYKYPQMGIALFYSSLGNENVYGHALAINYFFRLKLIAREKFSLYNRMGIGLGYITRKFDFEDNYLNVVIGSHFNVHFNFRLGSTFDLTKRISINAGLSFDHYSNGNTNEPNIGLNLLTGFAGVNYLIGNRLERIECEVPKYEHGHALEIFVSYGTKRVRTLNSGYNHTLSFATEYNYFLSRFIHLGAGIDLFYDSSIRPNLIEADEVVRSTDNFQTGIHFSQTVVYRKFRFTLQEGVYVGLTNKIQSSMYNRGILKYYINDDFSVRLAMKSHLHLLDYPEIGFGYKF